MQELALYLTFPQLPIEEYSLRNTGNRGLEAFHSIFRGGTATLPITSANLSFQEFLTLMNKAVQISEAEHELQKIDGCTIVASKKKRKTCARDSGETASASYTTYKKPNSYEDFLKEIQDACVKGEEDAKSVISKLAPDMESVLKFKEKWDSPQLAVESSPTGLTIIKKSKDEIKVRTPIPHDQIIRAVLGPLDSTTLPNTVAANTAPELESAYANLITDLTVSDDDSLSTN
jgi:hypothetical protein